MASSKQTPAEWLHLFLLVRSQFSHFHTSLLELGVKMEKSSVLHWELKAVLAGLAFISVVFVKIPAWIFPLNPVTSSTFVAPSRSVSAAAPLCG